MPKGYANPPFSVEVLENNTERASNGCLLWTGRISPYGYALYPYQGRRPLVHRLVHDLLIGPIPDGETVDHQCHDPAVCAPSNSTECLHRRCVDYTHIKAMVQRDNNMRGGSPMAVKARQTECIRGHALAGDNLYITSEGRRHCRACAVTRGYQRRARLAVG